MVIAAVSVMVAGIGLLSAELAARQGLSIDPAAALREE